jgi:hypothetical protein
MLYLTLKVLVLFVGVLPRLEFGINAIFLDMLCDALEIPEERLFLLEVGGIWYCGPTVVLKIFELVLAFNFFFVFLKRFDVLMSKIK